MRYITINTSQNNEHFIRFTNGDEAAMSYIYNCLHAPLMQYGRRLLSDDFELATIVQEAFTRLWNFRHRITSMLHGFRFLRLVVRWGCYAWYRNPVNRFRRQCMQSSALVEKAIASTANEEVQELQEEQSQIIWQAVPFLPASKQTVLRLHFQQGLSAKQIASRFNTSNAAIHMALQTSLEHLKNIIGTKKSGAQSCIGKGATPLASSGTGTVQQQIQHLRRVQKKTFVQIALLLNMECAEVQRLYLAAWKEDNTTQRAHAATA